MNCKECNAESEKMYCSKLCANRAWKKSKTFLKNNCVSCNEPCRNLYCSHKCRYDINTIIYKENCLVCDKEFTYTKISYKIRGGMKYCSSVCANSVYDINHNFFKGNINISEIYQTMGFLFSCGRINDYGCNDIMMLSDKDLLEKLNKIIGSNYPIFAYLAPKQRHTNRLSIRSKEWIDYLSYIGFSHNEYLHEFPSILDEYKLDFIKGIIINNAAIYKKIDHNLIIITTKSHHLIKGIALVTGGKIVTKKLEFCCVIKDYNNIFI